MHPGSPVSGTAAASAAATRRQHWDRLGLGIRCGYDPQQPALIWRYLALGTRLADCGGLPRRQAFQRMLQLLLQTAHDEALPWYWRSVCLEHTTLPLARLVHLVRPGAPDLAEAWIGEVSAAQDRLAACQPAP
ncbi:MAG: hypothetical protein U5L05_01570 [Rubrivivax sp.]|nr:hypothetical protein [Rubrivivax sp.]